MTVPVTVSEIILFYFADVLSVGEGRSRRDPREDEAGAPQELRRRYTVLSNLLGSWAESLGYCSSRMYLLSETLTLVENGYGSCEAALIGCRGTVVG